MRRDLTRWVRASFAFGRVGSAMSLTWAGGGPRTRFARSRSRHRRRPADSVLIGQEPLEPRHLLAGDGALTEKQYLDRLAELDARKAAIQLAADEARAEADAT